MGLFDIRVLTLLADGQVFNVDLSQQANLLAALDTIRLDGRDGVPSSLLITLNARFRSSAGKRRFGAPSASRIGLATAVLDRNAPSRGYGLALRGTTQSIGVCLFIPLASGLSSAPGETIQDFPVLESGSATLRRGLVIRNRSGMDPVGGDGLAAS